MRRPLVERVARRRLLHPPPPRRPRCPPAFGATTAAAISVTTTATAAAAEKLALRWRLSTRNAGAKCRDQEGSVRHSIHRSASLVCEAVRER